MIYKPYQIEEARLQAELADTATIRQLKISLVPDDRTNLCPQCIRVGTIELPGYIPPPAAYSPVPRVECPTCEGWGFTIEELTASCVAYEYTPVT